MLPVLNSNEDFNAINVVQLTEDMETIAVSPESVSKELINSVCYIKFTTKPYNLQQPYNVAI